MGRYKLQDSERKTEQVHLVVKPGYKDKYTEQAKTKGFKNLNQYVEDLLEEDGKNIVALSTDQRLCEGFSKEGYPVGSVSK